MGEKMERPRKCPNCQRTYWDGWPKREPRHWLSGQEEKRKRHNEAQKRYQAKKKQQQEDGKNVA